MIDYITGKIAGLTPTSVVIDNSGIGYSMEISLQTYDSLNGKENAKVYIQSQLNQRDGTQVDYGFSSVDERNLFRLITGVSGIGAASARMILSAMNSEELQNAILSEDIARLKSIKGIGLKSAQRMILELKDKIFKGEEASASVLFREDNSKVSEEASSALQMLGFNKPNINKAIQQILKEKPDSSVEEIIKKALKML